MKEYEKGWSPSAIQRKYSLTYEQGYEIAEKIRIIQEENTKLKEDYNRMEKLLRKMEESDNAREKFQNEQIEKLKETLKECKTPLKVYNEMFGNKVELLTKIDEVLNG